MYRLIDTHAHLSEIADLEPALSAASAAGVVAIIAVGSDLESNRRVLEMARLHEGFVYPALGLHPWNLKDSDIDRDLEFIEAHIDRAVAVGEIGLDYHKKVRALAEKDLQKSVLNELLKIASSHKKPALIHSRYAWRDSFISVAEAKIERAVVHWDRGTASVLRDIVGQGYHISATPAVEYHEEHRRAVKDCPLDRLLLETDSPVIYQRGTPLEFSARPADVVRSLTAVAAARGMPPEDLARATTSNAIRFFGISQDRVPKKSH